MNLDQFLSTLETKPLGSISRHDFLTDQLKCSDDSVKALASMLLLEERDDYTIESFMSQEIQKEIDAQLIQEIFNAATKQSLSNNMDKMVPKGFKFYKGNNSPSRPWTQHRKGKFR